MTPIELPTEGGADSERGNTLVEVLVAVVILGLTVTAVLGNLLTTTSVSEQHRNTANFGAALASFAETARNTIELQAYNGSGTGPRFAPCATGYTIVGQPIPSSGPPGTLVTVLGTGFSPAAGKFAGATFNGSSITSLASTSSGPSGDIAQFTVPSVSPGSYPVKPFDGSHPAASSFTVTAPPGPSAAETIGGDAISYDTFTVTCTSVGSNSEQLQLDLSDSRPNNGAGARQVIDIPNLNPQGLSTAPVALAAAPPPASPSPPSGVAQQLKLTWYPPTYQGQGTLTGFKVYRSATSGGPWGTAIASVSSGSCTPQCSYTDTGLGNGSLYYYAVSAVTTAGESQLSPQTSGTTLPGTPGSPTPTSGTGQVSLSWAAPSGVVSGYNLYCSTTSGSLGPKVNSTPLSGTSYVDTTCNGSSLVNGNHYYYEVTATNSGGEGSPSTQVKGITLAGTPQSVSASPGNANVSISWTAPANGNEPITGYNVYCSTTAGVQGPKVNGSPVGGSPYTLSSCNGSSVTNGNKYFVEVTTVNAGGESVPTSQVHATAGAPTVPLNLTATPGTGKNKGSVTLTWTTPSSSNGSPITGYKIYRSTTNSMPGTPLTTVGSSPTTYSDTGLTQGQIYYYWVTAVNANGESPPASASATP